MAFENNVLIYFKKKKGGLSCNLFSYHIKIPYFKNEIVKLILKNISTTALLLRYKQNMQ